MIMSLLSAVLPSLFSTIDEVVEDKDKANKIKADIQVRLLEYKSKELESAAKIIIAEAGGHSWLQRNWRPLTMLTLVSLVAAHWLGFTAPNLPEGNVDSLLDIVKIGLGGYVVGRSAEKVAKEVGVKKP